MKPERTDMINKFPQALGLNSLLKLNSILLCIFGLLLTGCPPTTVVVPDLSGLTQAEADEALTDLGLEIGTVSESTSTTVSIGDVISQSPEASTQVEPGSSVVYRQGKWDKTA